MSARALSTATISFGLVSIPVKLFSTNESAGGISFNMLHKKCHSRLKQQYICPKDSEIVGRDEMVKGYEFAKDQYVVFTPDELKAVEEQSTQQIEITEFVPAAKVDPIFFESAYYLGPDKGGERAFRLIGEVMKQSGLCAVAKYASRGKGQLVMVRPFENGLLLQVLRHANEVRPLSDVPLVDAEVKAPELQLAMQFVKQLATDDFRPEKYEDEVKKRVQALVQKKVEGEGITVHAPEAPKAQIIDLMEALRASLGKQAAPAPATAETAENEADSETRKPPKRSPRAPKDEGAEEAPKKSRGAKK